MRKLPDKEIEAIAKIASALEGLDKETVARVLSWAAAKHGATIQLDRPSKSDRRTGATSDHSTFPDFYDATNPQTENEKVLVGAYWAQEVEGKETWDSQSINTSLKNLGHSISNITRTLDRLQEEKPRLALQVQKSGKSKQGRKLYKLTVEGIKAVRALQSRPREQ
jgi:hypothetical protein